MNVISVNAGLPREVIWRGKITSTAIFKQPVPGRLHVGLSNVEGDRQADQGVHGGAYKAVYGYAAEHYAFWMSELNRTDLPWGMFGENLTIEGGLFEDEVFVGDRLLAGTAEIMAIQPRLPCYKLGIRFGTQRMVKRFAKSGRFGVYLRVLKEGRVGAGDQASRIAEGGTGVSIGDLGRLLLGYEQDPALLRRSAAIEHLPERCRATLLAMLEGNREPSGDG
jgi:MOSC domain-containing protein YiiM